MHDTAKGSSTNSYTTRTNSYNKLSGSKLISADAIHTPTQITTHCTCPHQPIATPAHRQTGPTPQGPIITHWLVARPAHCRTGVSPYRSIPTINSLHQMHSQLTCNQSDWNKIHVAFIDDFPLLGWAQTRARLQRCDLCMKWSGYDNQENKKKTTLSQGFSLQSCMRQFTYIS